MLILFTGNQEVAEDDMTAWLERIGKFDFQVMLVSTRANGGMSFKQRARVGDFWKKAGREHPRIAVLTDSTIQRHIATAMSWLLGKPVKVVAPSELQAGLQYLGTRASVAEISRVLESVHAALDEKARLKTG